MIADVDLEAGKLTLNTDFVVRPICMPAALQSGHTHTQADGPRHPGLCVAGTLCTGASRPAGPECG